MLEVSLLHSHMLNQMFVIAVCANKGAILNSILTAGGLMTGFSVTSVSLLIYFIALKDALHCILCMQLDFGFCLF